MARTIRFRIVSIFSTLFGFCVPPKAAYSVALRVEMLRNLVFGPTLEEVSIKALVLMESGIMDAILFYLLLIEES